MRVRQVRLGPSRSKVSSCEARRFALLVGNSLCVSLCVS